MVLLWMLPVFGQQKQTIDSLNKLSFDYKVAHASTLDGLYLKNASNARKLNYALGEGESYGNLSLIYNYSGKYNLSTAYALKAINVFETSGNSQKVAFQYGELGYQMKRRDMKKAQFYMVKAKRIAEAARDTTSLLSIYNNYGVLKEMQQQLDSAMYFYQKGLKIKEAIHDEVGIPFSLNNLAIIHTMNGDFAKAYQLFTKALEMRLSRQDSVGIAENYCYYGDFYAAKKDWPQAVAYFSRSQQIAQRNKYAHLIQYTFENMGVAYEQMGSYKLALEQFKKAQQIKDSVLDVNTRNKISELEIQFETNQKEKQLALSRNHLLEEQSASRQKTIWLILAGGLLLGTAALGYLLYRQQRLRNLQITQEHELRSAIAQVETQNRLQEQRLGISRDLHDNIGSQLTFIISSVENLRYVFDISGTRLEEKLTHISSFTRDTIIELRDTIWAMNSEAITLEDLAVRISNFVEKAREAQPQIDFSYELARESGQVAFGSSVGINLYRCIQEAVNNAIKYASASKIRLNISVDSQIRVVISDNGVGFDPNLRASGNGLKNMEKRLLDIGGKFSLDTSPGNGCRITLEVPKESGPLT